MDREEKASQNKLYSSVGKEKPEKEANQYGELGKYHRSKWGECSKQRGSGFMQS